MCTPWVEWSIGSKHLVNLDIESEHLRSLEMRISNNSVVQLLSVTGSTCNCENQVEAQAHISLLATTDYGRFELKIMNACTCSTFTVSFIVKLVICSAPFCTHLLKLLCMKMCTLFYTLLKLFWIKAVFSNKICEILFFPLLHFRLQDYTLQHFPVIIC